MALLSLLVALALYIIFGWVVSVKLALLNGITYGAFWVLQRFGFKSIGDFGQSIFLPIFALMVSVVVKQNETITEEPEYFDSRLIILISCIIPLALIQLKRDYKLLFASLIPSFICLLLYDWVHNFFGVGYYQTGHNATNYQFTPIIYLIMYLLITGSSVYYKYLLENTQDKLLNSYHQVSDLYKEVQTQNEELQTQSEQLQDQADTLLQSEARLKEANEIIAAQTRFLEQENTNLQQHLVDNNHMLQSSNEALQKRLEELQQFSYTLSHNLRGPVASILGIFSLYNQEKAFPENGELIKHAHKSAKVLDDVITDLSQIIRIQDGRGLTEKVDLQAIVESILASLKPKINEEHIEIHSKLNVNELYAIRSYLYSILYNLISNAIKYRRQHQNTVIAIESHQLEDYVKVVVKDNGMGIDLDLHQNSIFKLYKRLTTHQEGRGLGLYLVKVQTEAMGGKIRVDSTLGKGSCFCIYLPNNPVAPTADQAQF